jgi:hypothetical protein
MKAMQTHPVCYAIRVAGHLSPNWADWFEGLAVRLAEDGSTLLTSAPIDQAALHSLLKKVRDLGIPLISVNRVETNETHPKRLKKEKK